MGTKVITENVIEEVYVEGVTTRPNKIQTFVKGQVVSEGQIAEYEERTGDKVPAIDLPTGAYAGPGSILTLDEKGKVAPGADPEDPTAEDPNAATANGDLDLTTKPEANKAEAKVDSKEESKTATKKGETK